MTNFNNYKFHCSSLYYLFTQPKTKKAREMGLLSETTKDYLLEMAITETYRRTKMIETDAMRKGTEQEQQSIDLLNEYKQTDYVKNKTQLENDYIIGTPDILNPVIDIKSCKDLFTLSTKTGITKLYEYQLYGYMILTEQTKAYLAYVLPNSPEWLIEKELKKYTFYRPQEEWQELEKQIRKNHIFDDVPLDKRIKMYELIIKNGIEFEIFNAVEKARNYLNSLLI
jgi:hypothetical protein